MLFRRGAGSGPGAARVFGAWRPAWRECRSAGAAFPRNTLQEIAEATSRGARPKAAKPHGPQREGAFHRTGSAAAVTAAIVAAETGAGERPPIAVSARNFKHSQTKKGL